MLLTIALLIESVNSHVAVEETCFLFLDRSAEWLLERYHLKHFLLQPFRAVFSAELSK